MHLSVRQHNIVDEGNVWAVGCEDSGGALLECDGEGAMFRQCTVNGVKNFTISDAIAVMMMSVL